jgi:hypothetical protein
MCRNSHRAPTKAGAADHSVKSTRRLCFIFLVYFFLLRTGCAALLRRNS